MIAIITSFPFITTSTIPIKPFRCLPLFSCYDLRPACLLFDITRFRICPFYVCDSPDLLHEASTQTSTRITTTPPQPIRSALTSTPQVHSTLITPPSQLTPQHPRNPPTAASTLSKSPVQHSPSSFPPHHHYNMHIIYAGVQTSSSDLFYCRVLFGRRLSSL